MPNTVRAAAEGLPKIHRRKALAVTGSGLIAALAGVAASTMPAPALPIADENVHAKVRRLSRELSIALDEWKDDMGEGWHVAIWPKSAREYSVAFINDSATESARAAAAANTPAMVLFRKWRELYRRAGREGLDNVQVSRLVTRAHRLEKRLVAMPIDTPTEYAAKVLAATGYGDFDFGDHEARLLADARQLVGEA